MMMIHRLPTLALLPLAMLTLAVPAETEEAASEAVSIQATVLQNGDSIAFGFDSLWVISGEHLARINPADNSVVDIAVEGFTGQNRGIAIGEGAVWAADVGGSTIYAVDPRTNQVSTAIRTAELRGTYGSIGVGEGAVWLVIAENRNRVLAGYDVKTGAETARIALPSTSNGVIVDFGAVWVAGTEKGELYRIDPTSNEIVATTKLHAKPRFLTSGEGFVWVLNQLDGTVQRIEGKTGTLLATVETGVPGSSDIDAGGGFIWTSSQLLPVVQIDPAANGLRGKYRAPSNLDMGNYIRYGSGSIWISGGPVMRIAPPE